jgi:polygalacturonase
MSSVGGTAAGGAGADGVGTGGASPAVFGGAANAPSCDDIGDEPTIPAAFTTVLATKMSTGGKLLDETDPDTKRIQDAIDACPAGRSVRLAVDGSSDAFLSGPLMLGSGVTLWIDAGVTLFASRDPRDFDAKVGACGGNNTGSGSCYGLINVGKADGAVMGAGTIDGRGGELMIGGAQTWWALENTDNGNLAAPRLVQVNGATGFTLYQVTLKNAPKFHVVIAGAQHFKVWGITINTPATAPNTDGVDPSASTDGIIAYNKITTGDDNIAIKGAGPPAVENLIIAHNHFGRGHGMSIGSETYGGVKNISVCDLSLDGTTNGLRIKSDSSRGGVVQGIRYTDICMRSVTNPLVFDPYYSSTTGMQLPDFKDIVVNNVHVLGGGKNKFRGYDAAHPLVINLDNVVFDGTPTVTAQDAAIALGPGAVNLTPAGSNVTVTNGTNGGASPRVCDNAWTTF